MTTTRALGRPRSPCTVPRSLGMATPSLCTLQGSAGGCDFIWLPSCTSLELNLKGFKAIRRRGPLSFANYKVNGSPGARPPFGRGSLCSQLTLRLAPTLSGSAGRQGTACSWKLPVPSVCALGRLAGAGHPPGPAHPPQSCSVCKGLSGTGSNKQSQAAKTQG